MKKKSVGLLSLVVMLTLVIWASEAVAYEPVGLDIVTPVVEKEETINKIVAFSQALNSLNDLDEIDDVEQGEEVAETEEDTQINPEEMTAGDHFNSAVLSNNMATVKSLLETGTDINGTDSQGRYALEMTYYFNNSEMAKLLLENGADVQLVTLEGTTLYEKAMESDSSYFKNIFKEYK